MFTNFTFFYPNTHFHIVLAVYTSVYSQVAIERFIDESQTSEVVYRIYHYHSVLLTHITKPKVNHFTSGSVLSPTLLYKPKEHPVHNQPVKSAQYRIEH